MRKPQTSRWLLQLDLGPAAGRAPATVYAPRRLFVQPGLPSPFGSGAGNPTADSAGQDTLFADRCSLLNGGPRARYTARGQKCDMQPSWAAFQAVGFLTAEKAAPRRVKRLIGDRYSEAFPRSSGRSFAVRLCHGPPAASPAAYGPIRLSLSGAVRRIP